LEWGVPARWTRYWLMALLLETPPSSSGPTQNILHILCTLLTDKSGRRGTERERERERERLVSRNFVFYQSKEAQQIPPPSPPPHQKLS